MNLSHRYVSGRQLPDKAVGLPDTACARVAMSQAATPGPVENLNRKVQRLDDQMAMLTREANAGLDHSAKISELEQQKTDIEAQLAPLKEQWQQEQQAIARVGEILSELQQEQADKETLVAELNDIKANLSEYEQNMVHWQVDEALIAQVIADWTGIPVGKMHEDEINAVLNLADSMKERVVGQDHALDLIAKTVQTSRAQLADENRPNGIFMLTGPSGVGKTETALTLAVKYMAQKKTSPLLICLSSKKSIKCHCY